MVVPGCKMIRHMTGHTLAVIGYQCSLLCFKPKEEVRIEDAQRWRTTIAHPEHVDGRVVALDRQTHAG
jgi:hypothetical protein